MNQVARPSGEGGERPLSPHRLRARVVASEPLPGEHHRLALRAPAIVADARPGQFIHVWCHAPEDLDKPPAAALLRRPYSISRLTPDGDLELLLRVRGTGGRILAAMPAGRDLDVIGPLGNGFRIRDGLRRALVVAGGIGVAPMPFLVQALRAKGTEVRLLVGAVSDEAFPYPVARTAPGRAAVPDLDALDAEVSFVSQSVEGLLVSDLLEPRLGELDSDSDEIFACGPRAMLQRITELTAGCAPVQVCLEERMACGVGACRSCVVPMRGEVGYRTVCRDGPVFSAEEIAWERLEA